MHYEFICPNAECSVHTAPRYLYGEISPLVMCGECKQSAKPKKLSAAKVAELDLPTPNEETP